MKLVFVLVVALVAIVAAFPTPQDSGLEVAPARVTRAAVPDPDPRHHGRGYGWDHGGHGWHHGGGRGWNGGGGGGGYYRGGYRGYGYGNHGYHRRSVLSESNAAAGAINTPFGSGSFATASSGAGSGLLGFGK